MRKTQRAPLWHAYNLAGYLGGIVSLAAIDSRHDELQWVEKVWEDITGQHLYPTGSLGYNELLQASGPNDTPVDAGQPTRHHQETCATVEWLMLNANLYQATGRVRYVQCMQQTIYNALLSAQSMDGMSWMYFTPLRYEKRWFAGQTSCCYWSGPRGIARLPEWIFALDEEGIRVNLYESCQATLQWNGSVVAIRQSSLYPESGRVLLEIQPEKPLHFTLRLRVPFHTSETQIRLNGRPILTVSEVAGYFCINHQWSAGDRVELAFSIPTAVQPFMHDRYGLVVRGAEVLTVDQRDNASLDLYQVATQESMALKSLDDVGGRRRYLGEVIVDQRRAEVIFTPYADCGNDGSRFRTAFPVSMGKTN
jgi:hypothetical protein